MTAELRKQILANIAWIIGLGVGSVGIVAGASVYLDVRRARIESTRNELSELAARVERRAAEDALDSGRVAEASSEARALATSESLRIEQLAAAARAAGVTVVALRGRRPEDRLDGRVVACAHELQVTGDYRRIAHFLGELQRARGTVGIEALELGPDGEDEGIRASLVVTWFARGAGDASPATETEAS